LYHDYSIKRLLLQADEMLRKDGVLQGRELHLLRQEGLLCVRLLQR
jgi:hypothetical protein